MGKRNPYENVALIRKSCTLQPQPSLSFTSSLSLCLHGHRHHQYFSSSSRFTLLKRLFFLSSTRLHHSSLQTHSPSRLCSAHKLPFYSIMDPKPRFRTICKAADVSVTQEESSSSSGGGGGGGDDGKNWVPVIPLSALPKGERRVIIQDGETILLLWYKNEVYAIENRSPAEGAYSEGLLNAKLTQDGCIVCPSTDSTFDLQTGAIKEWYPKNPVLRVLTPPLRTLYIYTVKADDENVYISISGGVTSDASAEIVFSGKAQPGVTATDVNVDEVRMIVDEGEGGFGFTERTELINGKAAVIGFLVLLDFELLTGKGLLKGTGFLDFLYSVSKALN